MIIKFFPTGTGSGYGPVEYLCSENPFGMGKREIAPVILRGDPKLMQMLIDAVPFKRKYTSGVISFAIEDAPTEEQLNKLMDEFEELAFAGLPLSSRSILWVKHEHMGRVELHFLTPRQELHSGRSFNICPPSWRKKYDYLCSKYNFKYG